MILLLFRTEYDFCAPVCKDLLKLYKEGSRIVRGRPAGCCFRFFVPPSISYVSYIDWDTLALLFGLMAVMKGFQKAGLFTYLGNQLLKRTATTKSMMFVLVFCRLCAAWL